MYVIIKKMESEEEIKGKAYVHWRSWHEAYSGLVDQDYLDRLDLQVCEKIAQSFQENTYIAKRDDRVIAFVAYSHSQEDHSGEIEAIYVLSDQQGKGIGNRLMEFAEEKLTDCKRIFLWVLKDNHKAIGFYEHCGYHADGTEKDLRLGTSIKAIRMIKEKEGKG